MFLRFQNSECLLSKDIFFSLNVVIDLNQNIMRGIKSCWPAYPPIKIKTSISELSLMTFRDDDFEDQEANKMESLSI